MFLSKALTPSSPEFSVSDKNSLVAARESIISTLVSLLGFAGKFGFQIMNIFSVYPQYCTGHTSILKSLLFEILL